MRIRVLAAIAGVLAGACSQHNSSHPDVRVQLAALLKADPDNLFIVGGPPATSAPQCTSDHRAAYHAETCVIATSGLAAAPAASYQVYLSSGSGGECIKAVEDAAGKRLPVRSTCP